VREIRTLRAMCRALETELRQLLNGHDKGNLGYKPRRNLRATAPALDPTNPHRSTGRVQQIESLFLRRPDRLGPLDLIRRQMRSSLAKLHCFGLQSCRHTLFRSRHESPTLGRFASDSRVRLCSIGLCM
jgi:hypothetical protein